VWQFAYRHGFYRGGAVFMSALSGIDIALWDLKARKMNVPLYQLLGGKLRNKCRIYCWIGGDVPKDIEAAAYVPEDSAPYIPTDLNAGKHARRKDLLASR